MPIGRGLSSLIPPREGGNDVSAEQLQKTDRPPAPAAGSGLDSHRDASKTFGDQAHRGSETFSSAVLPRQMSGVGGKKPQSREAVFQIETNKIVPNPFQPRREFEDGTLDELAESIKQFGIIQPLIVSKVTEETETGTDVSYQLIAGERRLRAAQKLGLERVPVIVREIEYPGHKLELALIENIQRRDLNPIEEAKAYSRLQDEFGLTQKEIGVRVGKSREVVANSLRLLNLPRDIQKALAESKISESQARALLSIPNAADQERTFRDILDQKLSVRSIRSEIKKQERPEDPEVIFLKKKLEEHLGMPVRIVGQGGKGKIVIDFFSKEDIKNFIDKLGGE